MKKFLLMFAAVAAIAFVGCKTESAQPAEETTDSTEVVAAEPTVESVTAELMKLVEAKNEEGTLNFLDGLKKTAEDFLTAGESDKYFNIINIIKTVWDTNKDKIMEYLPGLADKMTDYINVPEQYKAGFADFIAKQAGEAVDAAKDKAGEAVDAAKDKAGEVVDAAKDKAGEAVDAAKDAAGDAAQKAADALKN